MVASPIFQIFHLGKRAESRHMNRNQFHLGNRASPVNRDHVKRPLEGPMCRLAPGAEGRVMP